MNKRFLRKYDGKKYGWFLQTREMILMLVAVVLLFQFVVGVSMVRGDSMYPALKDGDIVLYKRIVRDYAYGDVVYVHMPSGERYVKRVVALAGDTVDIRDGRLYINGVEETASYVNGSTGGHKDGVSYPYTVEEGRLFVLGDNREVSTDSRIFGSLPIRQVRGKLIRMKKE